MARAGILDKKKLLLIDKARKTVNDRTWCFWEKSKGPFEEIVFKSWDRAWVKNEHSERLLHLAPYSYKMIRGIDFYNRCDKILKEYPNLDRLYVPVSKCSFNQNKIIVAAGDNEFSADYVFNSISFEKDKTKQQKPDLLQHFKGWFITSNQDVFNAEEATLMDFRVPQQNGTGFVYVMPFTNRKALIEYTIISPELLKSQAYDDALSTYLADTGIRDYQVTESEFGIIPMSKQQFPKREHNMMFIGTAGGQTKASSGYTFQFIQKQSAAIVQSLLTTGQPFSKLSRGIAKRFRWYDNVLLQVLKNNKPEGKEVFDILFSKNKPSQVLQFLDNETSLLQELKIMRSVPQLPFIKAGLLEIFR